MPEPRSDANRDMLGDIPVFWADAPVPFTGALTFRVGRADETLTSGGLTHLVEHLALFPLGQRPYAFNAAVDHTRTTFWASGTPEQVAEHLHAVARNLHALPLDRLDVERQILRTEASNKASGTHSRLWERRFGFVGYGLLDQVEWGLRTLDASRIESWAKERFTAGNAAMWFTGRAPNGLELELPSGCRFAPPAPIPRRELETPSHYVQGRSAVAVSMLVPRDHASVAALVVLERLAHARLRIERGSSYAVGSLRVPLTVDTAYTWLTADGAAENGTAIAQEISDLFESCVRDAVDPSMLTSVIDTWLRGLDEPIATPSWLDLAASDELLGSPPRAVAEDRAAIAALEPEAVRCAVDDALASARLAIPEGATPPTGPFEERSPGPAFEEVAGDKVRSWNGSETKLVLGEEGLSHESDEGLVTVRWDGCVGVFTDGRGRRIVCDPTGSTVTFDPWYLEDSDGVVRTLHERLAGDLFVDMADNPDRTERLRAIADDSGLDRAKQWKNVLEARTQLKDDEEWVAACEARHAHKAGMLFVTGTRLMHVSQDRPPNRRTLYWKLEGFQKVRVERGLPLGGGSIVLTPNKKGLKTGLTFEGIRPHARLTQVADVIRSTGNF